MPPPPPNLPWYQFSLRSLLLFTSFVAALCSLGVCTHWLVSAVIVLPVVVGGMAGRIVAGTRLGFVQGVVFGTQFLLVCEFLPFLWKPSWLLGVVIAIAVLIGGMVGGLSVRPRSR